MSSSDCPGRKRNRCPLHKEIRQKEWPVVLERVRKDSSLIFIMNSVGWSSLTLAIYHGAPPELIMEMLALSPSQDLHKLLSTPIPTGRRLVLHFAVRFCKTLEVIQAIAEPHRRALLHKSEDGVTPLDRARYYRQDASILDWLTRATEQEERKWLRQKQNKRLQQEVRCCCHILYKSGDRQEFPSQLDDGARFVVSLFSYMEEREMKLLFEEILAYVGIPEWRADRFAWLCWFHPFGTPPPSCPKREANMWRIITAWLIGIRECKS